MPKSTDICLRCGLPVVPISRGWKHCANVHTKSCGKAPHVVKRQDYEASITDIVSATVLSVSKPSRSVMSNHAINKAFLSVADVKTSDAVLSAVANHYGITKAEALEEVTHDEAEHLLDYLTGSVRSATSVLMRRHGLGAE